MADEKVRPLQGSSFQSFENAVLNAIASGGSTPQNGPRRFNVLQLRVEMGGVVGRPQFIAEVALDAGPNA